MATGAAGGAMVKAARIVVLSFDQSMLHQILLGLAEFAQQVKPHHSLSALSRHVTALQQVAGQSPGAHLVGTAALARRTLCSTAPATCLHRSPSTCCNADTF